jgi:hypothetical protein
VVKDFRGSDIKAVLGETEFGTPVKPALARMLCERMAIVLPEVLKGKVAFSAKGYCSPYVKGIGVVEN